MKLERNNGTDWVPYVYYAEDCPSSMYAMPNTMPGDSPSLEPVCTSSQYQNFSGAVVTFNTSDHLSVDTPRDVENKYCTIYGLRIVVDDIAIFNDSNDDSEVISIAEWSALGTCMCNGHASECSPLEGEDTFLDKVYAGCDCYHNTTGTHCELCSLGYTHRPWQPGNETNANECQACGCNPEASASEFCDSTTGQCNCTENAIGLQCMDCPRTHYNTTGSNQDYCIECFCFGHSTSCVGDNEGYNLTAVEDSTSEMFNNRWTGIGITFIPGFVSTDGLSYSVSSDEAFFIAPDSYHRDFKLSYGHSLTFVFELDDKAELNDNRYVMISNSELSLFSLFESPIIEGLEYSFTIPFLESYWRVSNSSGRVATLGELIDVLANVTDFRFTAKFTNLVVEINLISLVRWEYLSMEPTEDSISFTAEACYCPSEYTGQFCEECTEGYYRMRNSLVADCIECECNNRSDSCTTPTGVCVNCTGNWQGDHCDECPFDYYPDPNGTDCIPCASGYRGDQCDQCDNGYYNNSGSCELCNCNDNINTSIDPFCNPMTGECLNCTNNTQGFNCDICATGYYGADSTSCQICDCNYEGTLPDICNNTTGNCLCKSNNTVPDCSECLPGFYGDIATCEICNCDIDGALPEICNRTTGECLCKSENIVPDCSECKSGFYGDLASNDTCEVCNCDIDGVLPEICNSTTGECLCKSQNTVTDCSECESGFYSNLASNDTCEVCACDIDRVLPGICNSTTGKCLCKSENTVSDCSECLPGFYSDTSSNDTQCQACGCNPEASASEFCDSTTGQCNCTENAIGLQCMDCPRTHYNTTGSGQDYCIECFCFGHSTSCVGDNEGYNLAAVETDFASLIAPRINQSDNCNTIGDWIFDGISILCSDEYGANGMHYYVTGQSAIMIAPGSYHGDFTLSYRQSLTIEFVLNFTPLISYNYIRISNSDLILYSPFPLYSKENTTYTFEVPFFESYWRVGSLNGRIASIGELINVLANVTDFRFTGNLTDDMSKLHTLSSVRWDYLSIEPTNDSDSITVEACLCPIGYTGQFCEECTEGYYRMNNSLVADCIECECNNRSDSCTTPTGVCVNCTGNWQGDHCDECPFEYYPDPNGTDCIPCASGYRGDQCDQCDNGYYNNSDSCEPCNCNGNINTSIDPFCNPMTGECFNCTNNTQGFNCDICATGYYGADSTSCQICDCNYEGTLPEICNSTTGECLCLGHSSSCTLDNNNYTLTAVETDFASLIADSIGDNCNNFGDWIFEGISILCSDEYGADGMHYYVTGLSAIMIAPESYHGDFTLSYRQSLTIEFVLNFTPLISYNYIRISNSDLILYSPFPLYSKESMTYIFEVPFLESYWRVGSLNGRVASADELIDVLANVTDFRFTGNLTDDMSKLHTLSSVRWEYLGKELNLECPPGFYENPTDDETCTRCPCPTANNSHASSCYVDTDDLITCNNCDDGHSGRYCQECSEGYYGDPLAGECLKCDCGSNYDITSCDNMTGVCSECVNNITYGAACDSCVDGYYGDPAANIPCTLCSHCNINGTTPEICEMRYGICFCKPNVNGENCTVCEEGLFGAPDLDISCEPCPCFNIDDPICHLNSDDLVSAICDNCGPAYDGDLCQNCANGYYWSESDNTSACIPCDCNNNVDLSLGLVCHPNNGTCINCLNNTYGPNCDQCAVGYYGDVVNGVLCEACNCSLNGTQEGICDPTNGTCLCLPNLNGKTCSSCLPGFWESNLELGCQACDCCTNGSYPPYECDQMGGQCVCLPGVGGLQCCECAPGYFGSIEAGCADCECNQGKVLSKECNSTGHCQCQDGAIGKKCDECSFGYIDEGANCTKCHDCFFLWNDIITELNQDAGSVFNNIKEVIDFYKGFDVAAVSSTIGQIETALLIANQTLAVLSADTDVFKSIHNTLNEINTKYLELYDQSQELNDTLTTTNQMLTEIMTFVDETSVNTGIMLHSNLLEYMAMVQDLQSHANFNFETIKLNQQKLLMLKDSVNGFFNQTNIANEELLVAMSASNISIEIAHIASSLGKNLSVVESSLNLLGKRVEIFDEGLSNGIMNTDELMVQLEMLDETLTTFSHQLQSISVLSEIVENSTTEVQKQADNLLHNVETIKKATNKSVESARKLMDQLESSEEQAVSLSTDLTEIRTIMEDLNEVSMPSTDRAMSVAAAITTTIIPEEEVNEIVEDARESLKKANGYLEAAVNASEATKDLDTLVDSIQSDKHTSETLIEDTEQNLADVPNNLNMTETSLEELSENLTIDGDEFTPAVFTTQGNLESGTDALDQLESDVADAYENSKDITDTVNSENDNIETDASTLSKLKQIATDRREVSASNAKRAGKARDSSEDSNNRATKVSLDDLKDLLNNYKKQLADVNEAKQKIKNLEEELEGLSTSFNKASEKFKNCYKTP